MAAKCSLSVRFSVLIACVGLVKCSANTTVNPVEATTANSTVNTTEEEVDYPDNITFETVTSDADCPSCPQKIKVDPVGIAPNVILANAPVRGCRPGQGRKNGTCRDSV